MQAIQHLKRVGPDTEKRTVRRCRAAKRMPNIGRASS